MARAKKRASKKSAKPAKRPRTERIIAALRRLQRERETKSAKACLDVAIILAEDPKTTSSELRQWTRQALEHDRVQVEGKFAEIEKLIGDLMAKRELEDDLLDDAVEQMEGDGGGAERSTSTN